MTDSIAELDDRASEELLHELWSYLDERRCGTSTAGSSTISSCGTTWHCNTDAAISLWASGGRCADSRSAPEPRLVYWLTSVGAGGRQSASPSGYGWPLRVAAAQMSRAPVVDVAVAPRVGHTDPDVTATGAAGRAATVATDDEGGGAVVVGARVVEVVVAGGTVVVACSGCRRQQ